MSNKKIDTFLRDCLLKCRDVPQPGDDITWSTLEKDRGHVSLVKAISDAIADASGDSKNIEGGKSTRIDEPFRDITINTWYKLFHVGNYYAGLFVPDTKDDKKKREILQIWDLLIRNSILGEVYLGYGEDLIELDREIMKLKNDQDNFPNAQLRCPFRLYTRNGFGKFYSILAGHYIEDEKLEERVVKFWIRDANYWLNWWHVLTETLGGFERVKALAKFVGVRTIVSTGEGEEELTKELSDAMEGVYPVLVRKGGVAKIRAGGGEITENDYQPHEFVPLDAPRQLFDFYVTFFDLMTDDLGYSGKSSPHKMERLTQQESIQGSNVVSTIQYYLSQRLNSCFDVAREVLGDAIPEDFKVVITNRASASALLDPERGEIMDQLQQLGQNNGFNNFNNNNDAQGHD